MCLWIIGKYILQSGSDKPVQAGTERELYSTQNLST